MKWYSWIIIGVVAVLAVDGMSDKTGSMSGVKKKNPRKSKRK